MGVVYRATDMALDRQVALKLIAPAAALDPVFRARFEHECRAAAAIDHPHAVEIFHAGEEDGVLYVTMRFVEGTDLGALLAREQSLEPARAVGLIAQVAGALEGVKDAISGDDDDDDDDDKKQSSSSRRRSSSGSSSSRSRSRKSS